MAIQAYHDWVKAGRLWTSAAPVAAYKAAFRAAGWPVTSIGTIGDETHLRADRPKDHCPFSVTGWPVAHPYPYVTAIDVSHGRVQPSVLGSIVGYWVSEARADRTPWVKYIIYKRRSWDVRLGWAGAAATGHDDHVHVSMRSDHVATDIGDWPILGKGKPVADSQTGRDVWGQEIFSPALDYRQPAGEWLKWVLSTARNVETVGEAVRQIRTALAELRAQPTQPVDAAALAAALAAQQDFVDALATALAAKVGMIPQAREIAKAVGDLTWHGKAD